MILHSNSHLYLVQATIEPKSRFIIRFHCIASGTFHSTILFANHSITAVFPTPGSPTRHGLFLVFLFITEINLSISLSLPIILSIFPFAASSVKSIQKKSRA
ncbi:TPA: hypothetical protein DEG21_05330 [Patescibacteria group bacterium]|nr:hypothetical protein [Candidatus Gracilibacteria bacterium]HBY75251.1 hypothetical protein [Candidatus Gracilibacteria bacterium]